MFIIIWQYSKYNESEDSNYGSISSTYHKDTSILHDLLCSFNNEPCKKFDPLSIKKFNTLYNTNYSDYVIEKAFILDLDKIEIVLNGLRHQIELFLSKSTLNLIYCDIDGDLLPEQSYFEVYFNGRKIRYSYLTDDGETFMGLYGSYSFYEAALAHFDDIYIVFLKKG